MDSSKMKNNKPLGMKWYKFLTNFALIAGAIYQLMYGMLYLTGGIYLHSVSGSVTPEQVYANYGSRLQDADKLYGIFWIAFAVYTFFLFLKMEHFAPETPQMFYAFCVILGIAPFIYALLVPRITKQPMDVSAIFSPLIGAVLLICNVIYFKKRAHLFGGKAASAESTAKVPSEIVYRVPNTASSPTENKAPAANRKGSFFCKHCGRRLMENAEFCHSCGAKVSDH